MPGERRRSEGLWACVLAGVRAEAPARSGGLDAKAPGGRGRRRLPCDVDEHGAESALAGAAEGSGVPVPLASGRESQERPRRNGGTTFRRESVGHAAMCSVAGRVRPAVHPGAEHAAPRSVLRGRRSALALVWVERHDDPQCATRSASTKLGAGSCQSPNVRTGTLPRTRSPPARRRRRRGHRHQRFRHSLTTSPPPTSSLPSTSSSVQGLEFGANLTDPRHRPASGAESAARSPSCGRRKTIGAAYVARRAPAARVVCRLFGQPAEPERPRRRRTGTRRLRAPTQSGPDGRAGRQHDPARHALSRGSATSRAGRTAPQRRVRVRGAAVEHGLRDRFQRGRVRVSQPGGGGWRAPVRSSRSLATTREQC